MKIIEFRAENFMRLSVVQVTPDGHLVQITGANGAGKSSTIDAIWGALGGADALPDEPIHAGKKTARVEVKLGDKDGLKLIVERKFTEKGTTLTVKGPDGGKFGSPQTMMKELTGAISFDPLDFMHREAREQFAMLRKLVKLEVDVDALERQRKTIYDERTALTRTVTSARNRVEAIKVPADLPDEAPDVDRLTRALADAGEHNRLVDQSERLIESAKGYLETGEAELERLLQHVELKKSEVAGLRSELEAMQKKPIPDRIDVNELVAQIDSTKPILEGLRLREQRIAADAELTTLTREHDDKTAKIAELEGRKAKALDGVKMPVEGLSFHVPEGGELKDGTVRYNGHPLGQASSAEQLAVSVAIGAALNPKLRVMLCRDGSLLDSKSLKALGTFAEQNDMQIFLERVDESGEIGVVIEDGHVKGQEKLVEEFLKDEAERAKAPADAPPPETKPDEARMARALAYLEAELAKLPGYNTAKDCDKANATVKHMLAAFPELFAEKWTPAYLAQVKTFATKKS